MELDNNEIRYLLQNAGKIKKDSKCIECDGTGYYNYNENGEDIKNGECYSSTRHSEKCTYCYGVGYI